MVHEQTVYLRNRYDTEPDSIEVLETDLIDRVRKNYFATFLFAIEELNLLFKNPKARQINILNLKPFFDSEIFKANRFTHDPKKKMIIQAL